MTLLHQAAQKAVEAKQREAFEHWYSDAGRWPKSVARGEDGHYLLAQTNSSYEAWRAAVAALQQQPEPVALKDGVPNTEAAIAYSLDRWGYRQGTKECIAFYRGACWLQLATPPALQHQEVPREPVSDAAIFAIAGSLGWCRLIPEDYCRQMGVPEGARWSNTMTADDVLLFARALLAASPSTTRQQEVGSGWRPIESAPKDGSEMLLSNGQIVAQGWWEHQEPYIREHRDMDGRYIDQDEHDGYDGWLDFAGGMLPEPTHWMPLPAAPSTPEKAGGVPAFDPTQPCLMQSHTLIGPAPTMTYCQRCKNPHHACDGGVPSPIPHPLPAQANDGGEHG